MKAGWETALLGNFCDVLDYKRKPVTKRDRVAGKYPYYGATGILDYVGGFLFDEPLVLVGEDGAKWESGANTAFGITGKCWVNNHAHVLRPTRNRVIDNWLIYFLNHADLTGYVSGLTVPKLNQGNLLEIPVLLPPLPEQQRIVGILDEAFDGIATAKANAEKNLQNARALFESHLQSVFTQRGAGWEKKPLCELAENISTGPFGTMLHKSDYVPNGIPLVNPMNIVDGRIVPSDRMMVSEATRGRLSSYVLRADDIVIGRRGELGRCALVTDNEAGWLCGTGSFFVRFSGEMDGEFFVAQFSSAQFRSRLEGEAVGTTMSSLNHGILNNLRILVPTLTEQREIMSKARKVQEAVQGLEVLYRQKLTALDGLKKSILHQAFSGQL
ncbi:MAG: restriction endonuclease subunit S [Acidobacteriota bacterium]